MQPMRTIAPHRWLVRKIVAWLTTDKSDPWITPLINYQQLEQQIQPGDIVLVEGRSHVSEIIKSISQSTWSHATLYIGRLSDLKDPDIQTQVRNHFQGGDQEPLILEALLGQGTILTPLRQYAGVNLRLCRPHGLTQKERDAVIRYVVAGLGADYDFRQILDLARFLLPWSLFPRRWRSTLFQIRPGKNTRTVCSSLIAEAFQSIGFPILPVVVRDQGGHTHWFKRNVRLFTPRDFDVSPFFDIIKFPPPDYQGTPGYRDIQWEDEKTVCNAPGECYSTDTGEPVVSTTRGDRPAG